MPGLLVPASAPATHHQDLLRASLEQLVQLRKQRGGSPVVRMLSKQAKLGIEAALADPADRAALERAAAELRSCIQLVQDGHTSEGDHQLLEPLAVALSLIFEALDGHARVTAATADAAPAFAAALPQTAVASEPVSEKPAASGPRPWFAAGAVTARSDDGEALGMHLSRLERLYVARAACVDEPTSTLGELRAVEERIQRREVAVLSMAPSKSAWETGLRMVSGDGGIGTLLALKLSGRLWEWSSALTDALAAFAPAPAVQRSLAVDVLRLGPSDMPIADPSRVPQGVLPIEMRAAVLPLALEKDRPDADALLAMLDEPLPLAEAAADALAWCRCRDGGHHLLERALQHPPSRLSDALLLASVTQGDGEALSEIRFRLAADRVSPWLLDALAVAGEASDGHLLLQAAAGGGSLGSYALFACAHLGNPACMVGMDGLNSVFDPSLLDRAMAVLTGQDDSAILATARLTSGRPWSVAAAARRLEMPNDIPLPVLRWTALELAVRMGIAAPCPYDRASSADRQQQAARTFVATYGRLREPPAGNWLYFGKVID